VQHFIVGPVYDAHASFADLGDDATVAENLPDQNEYLIHQI
jgi:hypothetical protein